LPQSVPLPHPQPADFSKSRQKKGRGTTRATRLTNQIDQSKPAWWLVPRRGEGRGRPVLLVVVSGDERTSKKPSFPFADLLSALPC